MRKTMGKNLEGEQNESVELRSVASVAVEADACMRATRAPKASPLLWTVSQARACMVAKERFFPFT